MFNVQLFNMFHKFADLSGDGDGDGPDNIAIDADAEENAEDERMLEQIERELCGEFADPDISMLEQELQPEPNEQEDLAV